MIIITGTILSFIGSIILAFAVAKNEGEAHQIINGRTDYLAVIRISRFRWGIFFLGLGFLVQIVGLICQL